jgi:Na+-transporting NADH:ubiquinone oxidoreductase subunit NqrA
MQGKEKAFQIGLDALSKLTKGQLHLSMNPKMNFSGIYANAKNVTLHQF